jgi:type II secretory pathway component PulK
MRMNHHKRPGRPRQRHRRRGAAFLLALFVMLVTSILVVSIVDTQTLQFSALRNTRDYDRSRYLAEAGIAHALGILEQDWDDQNLRDNGIPATEFPIGSGNTYSVTAADGANGTVILNSTGIAGEFTRQLQITVKQGG